jgi:alpha/beta superfamily hydrolase
MNSELPVTIQSAGLRLEGRLREGDGDVAAVVLHPHPQYGGDMDNHVVMTLCRAIANEGATTLRFNSRGTGQSGGAFDGGAGEADDARAVVADIRGRRPGAKVVLAGYSFGAGIAASVADGVDVSGLILVSLPGQMAPRSLPDGVPAVLLTGDRDSISPPEALRALESPGRKLIVLPGVDHSWFPGADQLEEHVRAFIRNLPSGQ